MVLKVEKRAKLAGILTRRQGVSRGSSTFAPHALASATVAPSPTPSTPTVVVPLAVAQASPAPFPYERKVVEIEFDEDSAEGLVFKRLRLTTAPTSHSFTVDRLESPRDQTPRAPSSPDLFALEEMSTNREVQLGRVEAELLQHAKRFEEAEVELTRDVVDAYDAGFEDALAQVACAHPRWRFTLRSIKPCCKRADRYKDSSFLACTWLSNEQFIARL